MPISHPTAMENLSAQGELTFHEGRLISLNEEQLHQLTLSWTNVCRQVFADFDRFSCSVSSIPWTHNPDPTQTAPDSPVPAMVLLCRAAGNVQALCLALPAVFRHK